MYAHDSLDMRVDAGVPHVSANEHLCLDDSLVAAMDELNNSLVLRAQHKDAIAAQHDAVLGSADVGRYALEAVESCRPIVR